MLLEVARALAEQRIIDQAGGHEQDIGTNAEARKRYLLLHLGDDADYCEQERVCEEARTAVDSLSAEIANAQDERRERERLTTEKYADAVLSRSTRLIVGGEQ